MKTITMIHVGGFKKTVEILKVTETTVYIHWPIAGVYEVDLLTGRLCIDGVDARRTGQGYLDWRANSSDLAEAVREENAA